MKSYHILKRGSRFNFVMRIPKDLLGYFPVKVLYQSLRTADIKQARLHAASLEYETQRTFMRLRTNMLGTFEAQILVERLTKKIKKIDAVAYGQKQSPLLQAIEQHNINELMDIPQKCRKSSQPTSYIKLILYVCLFNVSAAGTYPIEA